MVRLTLTERTSNSWVGFASLIMLLLGAFAFFQGLIAIVRDRYYSLSPDEIIVFDLTTWGWIVLFWGSIVAMAAVALWSHSDLARWFGIGIVIVNILAELAFTGGNHYPLWALIDLALNIIVLYALIMRWNDEKPKPPA
jgi:hypothetical protein